MRKIDRSIDQSINHHLLLHRGLIASRTRCVQNDGSFLSEIRMYVFMRSECVRWDDGCCINAIPIAPLFCKYDPKER